MPPEEEGSEENVAPDGGATIVGSDQGEASLSEHDAFLQQVPEDIRGEKFFQETPNLKTMFKRALDAHRMVGANTIKIPGKNATDEEKSAYLKALGVPETPDKYQVPTEGMPEGVQLPEERIKGFFEVAHAHNVPAQAAAAIVRWYAESTAADQQAMSQSTEDFKAKSIQQLKDDPNFGGEAFDQNVRLAQNALGEFFGDEFKQYLEDTGLGNHPDMVRGMARVGRALASDEILGGGQNVNFTMTPAQAKDQWAALQRDAAFMEQLMNDHVPGHEEAVAKKRELFKHMHPGTSEDYAKSFGPVVAM